MVYKPMKFPFEKRVKLAQGLWMLSWVATLAAVFTFTLGCILKTEIRKREQVMANSDINIVPNTLIVVGLVSMGINYFAGRISQDALDVGRFPSWKKFLKPYFGISCFFTVLMLLSVVLSFVMRFSLSSSLRIGLKNGIRFYKDTDTPGRCFLKQSVDRVQMDFRCCGNNDHKDWFEVQWISNRFLDFNSEEVKRRVKNNIEGRYLMDAVPFSCCNPASPRPCIQNQLTNNSAHYNYEYKTEELNIYSRGCREALLSYYGNLMTTISAGVLSVFLIQGSVLVSVRYLQTSMESVTASNAESTTEGYLLEKDLKETVKEYLKPVLTLFMLNEVDEG